MIRETEVDGVPTLIAPSSGPFRAGLVFRVGQADEALPQAGITHLLEHLALHRHGQTDYHYNGSTDATFTSFHMQGAESEVVAFLSGVCDSLAEPPMERLPVEKEILRTEAAGRSGGVNRDLPLWRYGATGYGMPSYAEFGLTGIGPEQLSYWARTWFTRQNAVLWIAGADVPAGLRLRLPDGVRRGVPAVTSALPQTPAYYADGERGVVLDAVVRRRTAASLFAGVLERELFRALRQDGGCSYTATTDYHPRGDGYATVTAFADALPEKQGAVLGGFVDVLARLRVGRIDAADLAAVRAKSTEMFGHPDVHAARLPQAATNLLTGWPNRPLEELRAEIDAVTVAELHEVAQELTGTALLQVPECHLADWAGYVAAPTSSERLVDGQRFLLRGGGEAGLVIGVDGVSLTNGSTLATVRYEACAVMLSWPDGARQLIGLDGITLRIEPTLWQVDPRALGYLDSRVPRHLVAPMPARTPESIPQPKPPKQSAPTPAAAATAPMGVGRKVAVGILVTLTILCTLSGVLGTAGVASDPESDGYTWGVIIAGWLLTGLVTTAMVLVARRGRR